MLRTFLVIVLIVVGLAFPLLLNGQVYTNHLVAIACFGTIVVLEFGVCWMRDRSGTRLGIHPWMVLCSILVVILLATTLPSAFVQQEGFNKAVDRVRKMREQQNLKEPAK